MPRHRADEAKRTRLSGRELDLTALPGRKVRRGNPQIRNHQVVRDDARVLQDDHHALAVAPNDSWLGWPEAELQHRHHYWAAYRKALTGQQNCRERYYEEAEADQK